MIEKKTANITPSKESYSPIFTNFLIEWSAVIVSIIAGFCLGWRYSSLYFVDLRYQTLMYNDVSISRLVSMAGVVLLIVSIEFFVLKHYSPTYSPWSMWKTNAPLLLAFLYCFGSGGLAGIAFSLIIIACCGGRWGTQLQLPNCKWLNWVIAWIIVIGVVLLYSFGGAIAQIWSFNKMAMQWFDWGHFYETINNTLLGKWFHLNLNHGSFLYSRFCPFLLIMTPIVMLQSPELFLACGSLLIASGAIMVFGIARTLKLSELYSLTLAFVFLFNPITINISLPLLDGFHENFLLFPVVLGSWWCYRSGHIKWAWILVLFSLGIRETVGFMWFGWGIVLFLLGDRKNGISLSLVAICALVLTIGIIMPMLAPEELNTYCHVGFYHHLGNSIKEIALSPFLRPQVFWGVVFSKHTFVFLLMLLTPFIWLGSGGWRYWIPMLPDLLMISMDSRFDTQTIMRHYQVVPLLVLTIAMLEGTRQLKQNRTCGISSLIFYGITKRNICQGLIIATISSVVIGTLLFTQIPGTPGADPRLPNWSNAKPVLAQFLPLIPEKAKVSVGPRIASMLVGRNDLYFDHLPDCGDKSLQKYVFIESFSPMYEENLLRLKLLKSSQWRLVHSAFLDERLLQLFEYSKNVGQQKSKPGITTFKPEAWQNFGAVIPSSLPEIEIRGALTKTGGLLIAVQIKKTPKYDLGLRIEVKEQNGAVTTKFISFGNGAYPACFAQNGETFIYEINLSSAPISCLVTPVVL